MGTVLVLLFAPMVILVYLVVVFRVRWPDAESQTFGTVFGGLIVLGVLVGAGAGAVQYDYQNLPALVKAIRQAWEDR